LIKEIRHDNLWDERTFILKHPNQEVKQAFNRFLLSEYTHTKVTELHHLQISRALVQNDVARVIEKWIRLWFRKRMCFYLNSKWRKAQMLPCNS
jgi:hypothetical protein